MSLRLLMETRCDPFTVKLHRYGALLAMPRHAHDFSGTSVVLAGSVVEETSSKTAEASAGWIVSKPAGTYHANRFGPDGALMLGITFESGDHRLPAWGWRPNVRAWQSALRLLRLSRNSGSSFSDAVVEAIAATLETTNRSTPSWLAQVKEAVDDRSSDAPRVTALARMHKVHPVYLARRFRDAYGVSIREYGQMARVRRASALILGSKAPLSDIAHRCGFADHSHMCRAFRTVMGVNPALLRGSAI